LSPEKLTHPVDRAPLRTIRSKPRGPFLTKLGGTSKEKGGERLVDDVAGPGESILSRVDKGRRAIWNDASRTPFKRRAEEGNHRSGKNPKKAKDGAES